jgi:hypothetical protein
MRKSEMMLGPPASSVTFGSLGFAETGHLRKSEFGPSAESVPDIRVHIPH